MKPRILFILHLHDAIEKITNRSMRNSKTIAQNRPLLLTGTGCSALMREKRSHGTGKLQKKNSTNGGHVCNAPGCLIRVISNAPGCLIRVIGVLRFSELLFSHSQDETESINLKSLMRKRRLERHKFLAESSKPVTESLG